jgi:formylmethanofuran dehydrogenase subunit E
MIDKESEKAIIGWLRLGDRLTGRKAVEGRCDRCGETRYLAEVEIEPICAACYLDGEAVAS